MSTESIIVELNRNKSLAPTNNSNALNSEYTCQLKRPITVNPGDQVAMRMASIDTQKVTDDTIIINDDTNISILYSIYDYDYTTQDKIAIDNVTSKPDPGFDYYAAYVDATSLQELQSVELTIVGWVEQDFRPPPYSRNQGGSFVISKANGIGSSSDWFQVEVTYVDSLGEKQTALLTGNNATQDGKIGQLGWQTTGNTVTVRPEEKVIFKKGTAKVTGYSGNWPGPTTAPIYGACPPGEIPGQQKERPVTSTDFSVKNIAAFPAPAVGEQLDLRTTSVTIKKGKYDPKGFAIYMTQLLNSSQGLKGGRNAPKFIPANEFLQRTDDPDNANVFFYKVPTDVGDVTPNNDNAYRYTEPTFFGASQVALEFGSAGNIFSLNYAHMPLQNPGDPGKQVIAYHFNKTGDPDYNVALHASGIAIHELEPVEFWRDKLGLYNQLLVPLKTDTNGVKYYLESDLLTKITFGYDPLSAFLLKPPAHDEGTSPNYNSFRRMVPIPPALDPTGLPGIIYVDVTGSTRALLGTSQDVAATNGGYYLIELQGIPVRRGGFVDTEGENYAISAIVPKQYDSNNVITGFADSGIPFTHVGQPTQMSAIKVRILDENGDLVSDLGPNTAIFVEVTKQGPILRSEEQGQLAKTKKPETQSELRGD